MWHLVQLNEFGEFSPIWEKKGHFSFSKLDFPQSSLALATSPVVNLGNWMLFWFKMILSFFPFLAPFPPAHIDTCLGTVRTAPLSKTVDSEKSSYVARTGKHMKLAINWAQSKALRDCDMGQSKAWGTSSWLMGALVWERGEPENKHWGKAQGSRGGGWGKGHLAWSKCSPASCSCLLKCESVGFRISLCWNPALVLTTYLILTKSFHLSEPQFPISVKCDYLCCLYRKVGTLLVHIVVGSKLNVHTCSCNSVPTRESTAVESSL